MIKLYIYCSAFIIGHLVVGQVVGMKFHQAVMEIVSHDNSIKEITSDERKTLTKISTHNLSRQFPQTSAHYMHNKIRNEEKPKERRTVHNLWRTLGH